MPNKLDYCTVHNYLDIELHYVYGSTYILYTVGHYCANCEGREGQAGLHRFTFSYFLFQKNANLN